MKANKTSTPYLFLSPALIIYGVTVLIPILGTFLLSFVHWSGFGSFQFAWISNFTRAFTDSVFIHSLGHVLLYIVATLILEVAFGLLLAGIVTSHKSLNKYRVLFFIPVLLPTVVISVLWRSILNFDYGLLNGFLRMIGLGNFSHIWLGDSNFSMWAICLISGWNFSGFYLAIFYAGLQRVPGEIVEAAKLDGADEKTILWKIKVPMIRRITEIAALICITGGIQSFDLFYILTGGGPFHATEVPTTYMVQKVFQDQEVGYGAALAIIVTTLVVVVGLIFSRMRRKNQVSLEY
mgnify:CR=1 FL=1